jgi:7-cyano-7-deazaguanine synthase
MNKIVIGLSGGMDSATLLGTLLRQEYEVHCCSFYYGSKHNAFELQSAVDLVQFYREAGYGVYHTTFDLRYTFQYFNSALLTQGEKIPEGHYNNHNMRKTVVPGRNLIFASIMAGFAESIRADTIGLAVHAGDHHIYPDCRPDFLVSLQKTISHSSDGKIGLYVPFMNISKAEILRIGYSNSTEVPYLLTRTCYKEQIVACGKCGSCVERILSFNELGLVDPVSYEGTWDVVLKNALAL